MGDARCPCIGQTRLDNITAVQNITVGIVDGEPYSAFRADAVFPRSYGATCAAHDSRLDPYCTPSVDCEGSTTVSAWCADSWCWIDPSNCAGVLHTNTSGYFPGSGLAYSYETCGVSNLFDAFYLSQVYDPSPPPPISPPPDSPPPYAPPSPPPTEPPLPARNYALLVGVCTGSFGLVLVGLGGLAVRRESRRNQELARSRANDRLHIAKVVTRLHAMPAPVVLMTLERVMALGRLCPHEEGRDRGLLVTLDDKESLASFLADNKTIFVSHQWLGREEPDRAGQHYSAIVAACDALCVQHSIDPARLHLWIDFHSIPQRNSAVQQIYIDALPFFASTCHYFVTIAPTTRHDSGHLVDETTYLSRGWCRLEQCAKLAVGGAKHMHIMAGAPPMLSPLTGAGHEWILQIISVFDGAFSNPEDRQKLVEPMLGLWAMVLTGRHGANKELFDLFCSLSHEQWQCVFPHEYFGELPLLLAATLESSLAEKTESSIVDKVRRISQADEVRLSSTSCVRRCQEDARSAFSTLSKMQNPSPGPLSASRPWGPRMSPERWKGILMATSPLKRSSPLKRVTRHKQNIESSPPGEPASN